MVWRSHCHYRVTYFCMSYKLISALYIQCILSKLWKFLLCTSIERLRIVSTPSVVISLEAIFSSIASRCLNRFIMLSYVIYEDEYLQACDKSPQSYYVYVQGIVLWISHNSALKSCGTFMWPSTLTLPWGSYTDDKGCKRTMDPLCHSYVYTENKQGSNN
jgi:hypothetical protein